MDMGAMREKVFAAKPALRALVEKHGSQSSLEYFLESSAPAAPDDRAAELISVVEGEVRRLLGGDAAARAAETLRRQYLVSTADHHGPLTHPFFLNANLVEADTRRARGLSSVVVFACAGISLNNSSFPRGLLFHDAELRERRVHFLSLKHRNAPLYGLAPYGRLDVERARRELLRHGGMPALKSLLEEVYASPEVLALPSYSDQISHTNFLLWKRMPGEAEIDLIYLEQERIASLLLERHLERDTIVTRILTDHSYRAAFARHFDGIAGAFSSLHRSSPSVASRGTFLFWRIQNGMRVACRPEDVPTDPRALCAALARKELMPSMALSFIVTSFYHGLVCGGGFSQIDYLPAMQKAYAALAREYGHEEEAARSERVPAGIFRGEFVVAWLGGVNGAAITSVPATSVDFLIHGDSESSTRLRAAIAHTPLSAAVDAMMPEFYKIITGGRSERLAGRSPESIFATYAINVPVFAGAPCLVAR